MCECAFEDPPQILKTHLSPVRGEESIMKSFAVQVKHIVPFSLQKKSFASSLSREPLNLPLEGLRFTV